MKITEKCSVEGCSSVMLARSLCNAHYKKGRRAGSLKLVSIESRFWGKVRKGGDGECWEWVGSTVFGYGVISIQGRQRKAHRVSFEMAFGAVPPGSDIDHMCWNPSCVNPSHLRSVTRAQNLQNRSGANRNSTSGVRGVYLDRRRGTWYAEVTLNRTKHYLGSFSRKSHAEAVAIAWRNENMPYSNKDRRIENAAA